MVMERTEYLQTVLESLLVEEFRTVQKLQRLKLSESQALSDYDIHTVKELSENIEITTDNVQQLQNQRQVIENKIATELNDNSESPTAHNISRSLQSELNDRILRLREGIRALNDEIRQISIRNAAITPPIMKRPKELRDLPK